MSDASISDVYRAALSRHVGFNICEYGFELGFIANRREI